MALYKGKYRIESTRLKNWDYSRDGNYFITICTQNRAHFFGEIVNHKMILSQTGRFAEKHWLEIPAHFSFASLDAFVVMPDHIHGIVVIDAINRVSTINRGGITKHHNPMLHNNLPRIIRWYKGRTTFESRQIDPKFSWQPRYYDHVIRNETALNNIRRYIKNNPKMWNKKRNSNI